MASIVYRAMYEKMAEYTGRRPDYYEYEKYRTWRTLWLVKRTRRIPRWDQVTVQLWTER